MERSKKYLDESNAYSPDHETVHGEEIYHMTRLIVSTKHQKKRGVHRPTKKTLSDSIEINQTLKLAAKGYGVSHRTNVEGNNLAQNILANDGQEKKKGLFFLCC